MEDIRCYKLTIYYVSYLHGNHANTYTYIHSFSHSLSTQNLGFRHKVKVIKTWMIRLHALYTLFIIINKPMWLWMFITLLSSITSCCCLVRYFFCKWKTWLSRTLKFYLLPYWLVINKVNIQPDLQAPCSPSALARFVVICLQVDCPESALMKQVRFPLPSDIQSLG